MPCNNPGESGLGKTTFVNSLFNSNVYDKGHSARGDSKTTQINAKEYELIEEGVKLNLTVIDCPGFGDQLDRSKELTFNLCSFEPIIKYIDEQNVAYFTNETSVGARRNIIDTRVHALLYFLPPTGKYGFSTFIQA